MSLRNMEVQYVGGTLYLPPLEREVNHIVVRNEDVKDWEHFEPERTCKNVDDEFPFFKCSECGCYAVVGYGNSGDGLPSYCPNCGRKVVSE